jgi:hypothetical protein
MFCTMPVTTSAQFMAHCELHQQWQRASQTISGTSENCLILSRMNQIISNSHRKENRMARNERTSKRMGKIASKALRRKTSSKTTKSLAGSVLTQRPDRKKK